MKYLSVCSGIEAATVAWHPIGWKPWAFSEIDKFPSAVLALHYPSVPNLGDMTKFREWPDAAINILVGGTPCQSFSVAGLRRGLADPRGNLALTYLGIADRYRPEWLVWENVPGVLSSNKGRDFGAFLGALAELGYGWAYRVIDAQFVRVDGFGRAVPQRRRRVFVVGCLGGWRRAAAVLFEPESLCWNPAPRREAGERVAGAISASAGRRGGVDEGERGGLIAGTLNASGKAAGSATQQDAESGLLVAHALRAEGFDASEDGTGRGTPLVPIAFDCRQSDVVIYGDKCGPLDTDGTSQAVAFDMRGREGGAQFEGPHETANIRAASGGSSRSYVAQSWGVRRMMPRECERLQGFPEDYTLIPVRGKPAVDGPRYKALGNSMAVNVMRWLGRRIELVSEISNLRLEAAE